MQGMTRPSILVVEDFALLRSSVMQWLRVRFPGFHVKGVGSAEEALEHARISRPDVVLMDIDLPGISGFEATSLFRVRSPATAVLMLTMHDTPSHRQAAAAAGAAGYVAKSELEEQLGAALENLLGERARSPS
jgi:DNA-binding NarL/FixJ family response regulator